MRIPPSARRVSTLAVVLAASLTLAGVPGRGVAQQQAQPEASVTGGILAVVGRQVAWLNLEAPRHRTVSRFPSASNALELAAQADASHAVVALGTPFPGGGARGADLVDLDLTSGDMSPLLQRETARESLNSPTWWPDGATLLFERQDLGGQPVGAPGQEVPRYPSRVERVMADGSGRGILLAEGRQPSPSPDGTRMVFARTTNLGASVLVWSQADGSLLTLVPEGRFADVAYPQFSPKSDQVAFVAPQSGVGGSRFDRPLLAIETLFGPAVAFAHGIPWDPWIVNADGSGLHRVAETAADEPSVSWSPDETQLFVYSGTGSFLVDAASGAASALSFVQGYGPTVWLATN